MLSRKGFVRSRLLRPLLRRTTERLLNVADTPIRFANVEMSAQLATVAHLRTAYPDLSAAPRANAALLNAEAKVFSQHGEDGVLAYIFSRIGATDRRFIEFGVEDGTECNTANLSIHFGWSGLLIEGNASYVARARNHYAMNLRNEAARVAIVHGFVTAENVNELFRTNGFSGELDLLSIDIDGSDYWVWQAISVVTPRVVCAEYNSTFGPERSVAVEYDPQFERFQKHPSGFYYGASLTALTKLARAKGYILIGCESQGVNAFFVRRDVAEGRFEEVAPSAAFIPQRSRIVEMTVADQFRAIEALPLVEV